MLKDTMFADSMLETSWTQRSHCSWTTLISFGFEVLVIGLLLLLPVLQTVGLPSVRTVSTPISAGRLSAEPPLQKPRTESTSTSTSNFVGRTLMQPQRIPTIVSMGKDEPSPQPPAGPGGGLEGTGFPMGEGGGLPISIFGGTRPVLPTPPPPTARAIRTSRMLEGNLARRVTPEYPYTAKMAHVEGQVVLSAIISKDGTIENLHVLRGHPLLVRAAIEAVSQWRYHPYLLNGDPVEVETQITVNFTLLGS